MDILNEYTFKQAVANVRLEGLEPSEETLKVLKNAISNGPLNTPETINALKKKTKIIPFPLMRQRSNITLAQLHP